MAPSMTGIEPHTPDPLRGEVWLARLGAPSDGEPGKNRPVVVIQVNELAPYGATDLIPVIPISSSRAPSPARIAVTANGVLKRPSVVVCRAIRGVARSRLLEKLGELNDDEMAAVEHALARVLGLEGR